MFQEVAAAMNQARVGSIIADSEEPVRDAIIRLSGLRAMTVGLARQNRFAVA
jgi:hypothetical protein